MKNKEVTILGAGPAGLGAVLELQKNNVKDVLVIDANSKAGGLARTEIFENNRFDIGPHRFFTKNNEVNELWHDILGDDFRPVQRLTRIYYKNKFFNYPLKPLNVLASLGLYESTQALISYLYSLIKFPRKEAVTFEEWVTNHFGKKLYQMFFKTYTEKVWGIDCSKIGANWAAQRIKGMNLFTTIVDALTPSKKNKKAKSLVEEFDYPIYGAGMMYEKMAEKICDNGGEFSFDTTVKRINLKDNKVVSIIVEDKDKESELPIQTVFSSIPLTHLIKWMRPEVPNEVLQSAEKLYFRDHITVNLIIDKGGLFDDQWIYVHSSDVKMGRLVNYNNFSSNMPANKNTTAVSAEYFVFKNDDIWNLSDEEIIELAKNELDYMNLVDKSLIRKGLVVRETESYPIYFIGFEKHYETIRDFVSGISNLQCIGRGGMYKYNNQDHSLYTGMLAARNYCGANYNLWEVNIDAEYHEDARRDEQDNS